MERRNNEPLFDTINLEMTKTLREWHGSPYSSETAGKINTLIQLAQSAGYGISLEIDRKSWENKNAAKYLPNLIYRIDGDKAVIELDPIQDADKNESISLYAYADHPTDEYMPSTADFTIRCSDGNATFSPDEILGLQIVKERTFRTLKEVKDAFWPDVPDDEFLKMMDSGEFSEALIEMINGSTRGNQNPNE